MSEPRTPPPAAETLVSVTGPVLCAICAESVGTGEGFQYGITSLAKNHKLYAFVHRDCDDAWRKSLVNPDVKVGFRAAPEEGSTDADA